MYFAAPSVLGFSAQAQQQNQAVGPNQVLGQNQVATPNQPLGQQQPAGPVQAVGPIQAPTPVEAPTQATTQAQAAAQNPALAINPTLLQNPALVQDETLLQPEALVQSQSKSWTFTPAISIQETYTDDVDLDSRFKQSDFVTLTRVGGILNRSGPKLDLDLDYGLLYIFYPSLDSEENEFRHNLRANSQSEIIDEHLFFDTIFSVTQNFVDRRQSFATSQIAIADNRDTLSIVDVSPYYVNKVGGNFAVLTTGYRFNYLTSSDNITLQGVDIGNFSTTSHEFSSTLNSGTQFNKITWEFRNSYQALEYSNLPNDNIYLSNVTLDYNYNRHITFIASGGYTRRNNFVDAAFGTFSGVVWRVGARLTPGPRTELEVTYGKEFFGYAWDASGSYQITPTMSAEFEYQDRVGNSGLFLIDDLQNDFTTNNVDQAFLDLDNGRSKRALFTLSGVRGRTTISISGGFEDNASFIGGGLDFTRKSATVTLARIVSERLAINLSGTFFLEDFPTFVENDFYVGYTAGLQYTLKDNITLAVEYIHSARRQQIFNIIDRDSNYISATIGMTF